MNDNYELRMYFLTMYNISDIQKGIQCGHAAIEYGFWNHEDPIYQEWVKFHKTFIILNGGTSNEGEALIPEGISGQGSMEQHLLTLCENNITTAIFKEPDLNNSLSAIAFLVDERVFNKIDYPDFKGYLFNENRLNDKELRLSEEIFHVDAKFKKDRVKWLELIGGEKNVFLKTFLKQFRLA